MVLEKLGSSLKTTLSKIAKSMFVDEKLINELIRDIQRALLQADVNVQLVFKLTKEIKRRFQEEKAPAGISQKEFLVKVVHDELIKFLGGEKSEIVIEKKKPFKIMLIGLFGSGKCVKGDSIIQLSNGELKTIKEIYDKEKSEETKIEDGLTKECNIPIYSFNPKNLKIEKREASTIWKLKKTNPLLEISIDNGNNHKITVTPEHPFFVLDKGKLIKKRADKLKIDDKIATPQYIPFESEELNIKKILLNSSLELNFFDAGLASQLKEMLKAKYNTLKEAHEKLEIRQGFSRFSRGLKFGELSLSWIRSALKQGIKLKLSNEIKVKRNKEYSHIIPLEMSNNLAEFLGYVFGDGNINKNSINITTIDQEVIDRINELSKNLFNIKPSLLKNRNTWRISISSTNLVNYFNQIFKLPIGKKSDTMSMEMLMKLDKKFLSSFISAYFTCDGYADKKSRSIEITTASKIFSEQLRSILLRYKIFSSISLRKINNKFYYRIFIKGEDSERFAYNFEPVLTYKRNNLFSNFIIGNGQTQGKSHLIPAGNLLKEIREKYGATIGEIQKYVPSYGRYEAKGFITKASLKKFIKCLGKVKKSWLKILNKIKDKPLYYEELCARLNYSKQFMNAMLFRLKEQKLVLLERNSPLKITITEKGAEKLSLIESNAEEMLKNLAESDLCWIKVNSIEQKNTEEYVYDLTVNETHNFIANGIIVHNTTTIGKLIKFYQKRGFKIAAIGLDVHRPAAPEQLEQICKKLDAQCFINKKEKDALKIYKEFEKEFKDYDILIIDTAGRDALSKDLIKEIEGLNKYIKPNENLLVISADIGQSAQAQAQQFHDSCHVNGVIITKMDGTAKGGGALTACSVTDAPIKFIGVGEKPEDLEQFNPTGFVGRLLGMGDIEALLEKAKEAISQEDAEDLGKRMMKGEFNFIDLYEQMKMMNKMGSLTKIMDLIPGMGNLNIPKDMLKGQEGKVKIWKFVLQSMTKEELENPEIISGHRVERIAKGAGVTVGEVRELLKQYKMTKKMMKQMKGMGSEKDMNKMMKKFKGKMPKGFGM
ncbi:MAG: signal recognition particle receptor subunit alpha [Nanoarchaeota archaeon]|nr:signal recognition particle receptor subunit alpha [Nanoarchaeota archaeon]